MKRLCFFILSIVFLTTLSFAQERVDVIHLKSGEIVKGQIKENVPNKYIRIRIPGGNIVTYKYEEIDKLTSESADAPAVDSTALPHPDTTFVGLIKCAKQKQEFGMKLGLNFSDYYGKDIVGTQKLKFGYEAGFVFENHFDPSLAFQFEALYFTKGTKHSEPITDETGAVYGISDLTETLTYFEVPFLLKSYINNEQVSTFVEIGPYLAIKISGKFTYTELGQTWSGNLHGMESSEVGGILGCGIEGKEGLVSLRYEFGLTPIFTDTKIYNSTYSVQGGWKF